VHEFRTRFEGSHLHRSRRKRFEPSIL
jgi:hypothetical protein